MANVPNKPPIPNKPPVNKPLPAQASGVAQGGAEEGYEEEYVGGGSRFLVFAAVPSWLVSMVIHAVLLLVLAFISFGPDIKEKIVKMTIPPEDEPEVIEEFEIEDIQEVDITDFSDVMPTPDAQPMMTETPIEDVNLSTDIDAAPLKIDDFVDYSDRTAPKNAIGQEIGTLKGTGLSGRGAAARGQMIGQYGGNEASEAAVARALEWFAKHQLPDGGWSFDHRVGACGGRCSHPGSAAEARNGATAMAVLPFLGAGQTHMEGKYKQNVGGAMDYLVASMKVTPNGGALNEGGGSMYSHGLASIALCEGYAMTKDKRLLGPAQQAIYFIVYAQDPVGGGWRYSPRTPGDTSVVGWQLMALKSGHMAYLQVPPATIQGSIKFLDNVGAESGAFYGYTTPGRGKATTAIGLLCRMYLGWDKDNPAIERGHQYLAQEGPSIQGNRASMYYNYYATQVMRHLEGEEWDKWNVVMRDGLVNSQNVDKESHEYGSWHFDGDHGADRGGRVYCTSLATMILEVYYRHMPIYQKAAATEEFPL